MVASDGGINNDHPRGAGTFPRVLGRFVREKKLFSLEEAVRKMTSLPATKHRLRDRGVLRQGAFADIVIFNPAIIADVATYDNPRQYPRGIAHVIVNGAFAMRDGTQTAARAGRMLRHTPA
jgi:N-acyl-D-aspartate/D-glutamate deacylase